MADLREFVETEPMFEYTYPRVLYDFAERTGAAVNFDPDETKVMEILHFLTTRRDDLPDLLDRMQLTHQMAMVLETTGNKVGNVRGKKRDRLMAAIRNRKWKRDSYRRVTDQIGRRLSEIESLPVNSRHRINAIAHLFRTLSVCPSFAAVHKRFGQVTRKKMTGIRIELREQDSELAETCLRCLEEIYWCEQAIAQASA